jgi:hypothetical protein
MGQLTMLCSFVFARASIVIPMQASLAAAPLIQSRPR